MWRHQVANLVTAASFIQYLENGTLLTKANADICIGGWSSGAHPACALPQCRAVASTPFAEIDLEDYLLGLCGLPSELVWALHRHIQTEDGLIRSPSRLGSA